MKMDSTISSFNAVVGEADAHIQEVQNNVSQKISYISAELFTTVKNLNEAVRYSKFLSPFL